MNLTFLLSLFYFLNCSDAETLPYSSFENQILTEITKPEFTAKVTRIIDGDTLEVIYGELPVMIRLAHIDCPEKRGSQPYGNAAKKVLSDLCFGQNIKIEFTGDKDRNGRYICVIYNPEGLNINKEMVRLGMAWHYKKYSTDKEYAELESEARKNKIGLWLDINPIPPWEWRK